MYRFGLLLILLLTGFASWAQPIPPYTPYTFRFETNRNAAEARTYLGIDIISGGASNAVVNINGMTNAQQRFQIRTNATTTGLPTVNTNWAGAIGTNFFDLPFAGPAVSGVMHSNDFKRLDTVVENSFSTNLIQNVFYIPAGAGAISNIVWESNTKYMLGIGTNTVRTDLPLVLDPPHLYINGKSNIVIEGFGYHSVVFTAQTGAVIRVENSYNIQFRNFRIQGTRDPDNILDFANGPVWGALEWSYPGGGHGADGMWLVDIHDHGIQDSFSSSGIDRNVTNCFVRNSFFINIGCTNTTNAAVSFDGAAIIIGGSGWTVNNNYFKNVFRCVECQGNFVNPKADLLISDNVAVDNTGEFLNYNMNPPLTDLTIVNNRIRAYRLTPHTGESIGLQFWNGGKRIIAKGNHIEGYYNGIQVLSNLDFNDNIFEANIIHASGQNGVAINDVDGAAGRIMGNIFKGNTISHSFSRGMALYGAHNVIEGNIFNRNATNDGQFAGVAQLEIRAFGTETGSNYITGNKFYNDNTVSTFKADHGLLLAAGTTNDIITDNIFSDATVSPWLDAGTAHQFRNNWVGTNLVTGGILHIAEALTPGTPAANHLAFYARDSGGVSRLFYKGDNGTEYGPLDAGGGSFITSVSTLQFDTTGGNLSFKNGGPITNLALYGNVGFSASMTFNTSEATDKLTINGNTNGTAHLTMTTGGEFARFFPGGGSLWDSPFTNTSTMYLTSAKVSGDITLTGGATGRVRMDGSTLGFVEFQAPASGQSNVIVLDLANTAPGGTLKIFSNTAAAGTNNLVVTNIGIAPFTNSYVGAVVFVPSDALAKDVQVLVATNDFQLNWTNQVSGKLISLSIYNNGASNITFTHHGGVRFMGGASNVVAAGRELAVAAKFIGTNISLAFAPQTN